MTNDLKLLSLADVAGILGVPVATVYNWRSRGDSCPPAIKIGRHLRFREADVRTWMDERFANASSSSKTA